IMFHLDEYIGLPATHPASFKKYIQERYLDQLPPLKAYYLINGENDPQLEINRLNESIAPFEIDLAMVGIGENGHLAFNDPPADFNTEAPYLLVNLDEGCRRQQLGEGWFDSLEEVPSQAISMSVHQILKSRNLICTVPDQRKAAAVKDCLEGPISNLHPASVLQDHPSTVFFFAQEASSLLNRSSE
ncbi:glucosamine-6-phosphate deaminase, partial [Dyadobacter jejuensis]